ncbi:10624_t:CDS:2 [Entrophospora sp. SA101]|nr:10624_t:CDS:2 [Entrophospora sp. SA101]
MYNKIVAHLSNRGFGRSLVESYYKQFRQELNSTTTTTIVNKLTLVLVGRNYDSLNSVKQNILNKEDDDKGGEGGTVVDIRIIENFDLEEMENLNSNLERLWQQIEAKFLKRLKSSLTNQRIIVNISSLLAIKPTPNWGLYCMAKSARDTYLAEGNNTKTLNYAPGPLNNDMQKQVRETIGDVEQKTLYTNFFNNNQLLDMNDSSQKLVNLLFKNNFKSGSHIDYYDI